MDEENVGHVQTEFYVVTKKEGIRPFEGKWVEPEIITSSKISQIQEDNMYFLIRKIST